MKRTGIKRIFLLAGIAVLGAVSNAYYYDASISIDRALNSPTLTVRYSGAAAAYVELRVNGVSVATRNVSASKNTGETNFTLDLSMLTDGDNEVEIRLLSKSGKIVGTEHSVISTDAATRGPVFLSAPKVGTTVQGPVEIKLGFGREMKNVYVSFFIDNQFKSMINVPPYNYLWDTARETNGWHEVEAWVVDDSSTTFKTRKIKIFVNNPSGNTTRTNPDVDVKPKVNDPKNVKPVDVKPIGNPIKNTGTSGQPSGIKTTPIGPGKSTEGNRAKPVEPKSTGITSPNTVDTQVGAPAGPKSVKLTNPIATGPKYLTPTGMRVAYTKPANSGVTVVKNVALSTHMITIAYGQKLPNVANYSILLNSQPVKFDVNPRVENGVPLTPFRHLLEKAGGQVNWDNASKIVDARAEGRAIWIKIGDKMARINDLPIQLELAPFLERGRTIVPLSFIRDSLNVNVEYDPTTGHVLITSKKK